MKKIFLTTACFFILYGIAAAEIERYNSRLPMMVYKGRESPYVLKLSSEGTVLTQAEIEAITKAAIIFNDETVDSDTCAACFDFGTGYKENGQILVDFGTVDFEPGRDRGAELVIYNSSYPNGRVFGTVDMEVSTDAIDGAALVDPLTSTLDGIGDVVITTPSNGQVLVYSTGQWINSTAAGTGDMLKVVYDTDADNRIDYAEAVSDGTNIKTAAQIKSHIDSTSNPHSTTAAQAGAVANTGDETVSGVKTFSSFPISPSSAPTTDYQFANRKFVIDSIGSTSGTMNTIKEGGSQVGDADITILDFDGSDFNTSETPDKEVNITVNDGGIDHNSLNNYSSSRHFLQSEISITASQINDTNAGTTITADLEEETHASEHQSGGADSIKLDDLAAPDDNTDLNSSALRHGLCPKLSNVSTEFLNGVGAFSTPAGSGGANITLDIGDDGGNDSTALSEIATSGDTNSVITEPSADKLLIDFTKNWPGADTANAGDSATSFFSTGTIEDARLPSGITRDTEWDTASEINAATTDADFLTAEVDGSTTNEINTITGDDSDTTSGVAITISGSGIASTSVSGDTVTVDATESDSVVGAVDGIVKANGAGVISAASAGTDYQEPLVADTDYLTPETAASTYEPLGVIDWTADQGATNIHLGNIPNLTGIYFVLGDDATTAEGRMGWDATLNRFEVGNGEGGIESFVPEGEDSSYEPAGVDADEVALADTGGNTAETEVEGAIAELYGLVGSGGGMTWELKDASFTAEADHGYMIKALDDVTITMPSSPVEGDIVGLDFPYDIGSHTILVDFDGVPFQFGTANLTIDTVGFYGKFLFVDSTVGWRAKDIGSNAVDIEEAVSEYACSCAGDLDFCWEVTADNTTITSSGGCSSGDTTASAASAVEMVAAPAGRTGYAIHWATSGDYYSFDVTTEDICNDAAGTITFDLYITTWNDYGELFTIYGDANDYIKVDMYDSDDLRLTHSGNGSVVRANTAVAGLTTSTWYSVTLKWRQGDTDPALSVSVNSVTGTNNTNLTAFDTQPTAVQIGAKDNGSNSYIKNIKVYQAWQ